MTDPKPQSLNLELLIKLLKLTTSSNDSEALLAARKANEVLAKFGGDWSALLHGKVTVIADPFSDPVVPHGRFENAPAPQPPRAPQAPQAHSAPRPITPSTPPSKKSWRAKPQPPTQPVYSQAPTPKKHKRGTISLDELA